MGPSGDSERRAYLQHVSPCSRPLRVRRHPRYSGSADPAVGCVRGRPGHLRVVPPSPPTLFKFFKLSFPTSPVVRCTLHWHSSPIARAQASTLFACPSPFGTVRGRHSTRKPPLWGTPINSGQIYFFAIVFLAQTSPSPPSSWPLAGRMPLRLARRLLVRYCTAITVLQT